MDELTFDEAVEKEKEFIGQIGGPATAGIVQTWLKYSDDGGST